jgi:hypothetical protein
MRLWCPGSSQLSCHNQTDPLPRRWSIARVWRGRWCAFQPRAPEWAGRSLKTNRAPWGTCRRAAGGASQKGPAIGDGSQSSEKRQSKSFRGRAKEGNCLRTSRALQKAGRPARSGAGPCFLLSPQSATIGIRCSGLGLQRLVHHIAERTRNGTVTVIAVEAVVKQLEL